MTLKAADIMQTQVITVSPVDPLHSVQRLFFEEEIHGAPVVDEQARVLGMITSMDLIRAATEQRDSDEGLQYADTLEDMSGFLADFSRTFRDRLSEAVAADAMTENPVSVAPDASVPDIARLLRDNRIHRVLVVKRGVLLGIISSFDLVALLEKES